MTTILNDTIEAGDVIEIDRNGETIYGARAAGR